MSDTRGADATGIAAALFILAGGPGLSLVAAWIFLFAAQTMSRWQPLRDLRLPPPRQRFVLAVFLAVAEVIKEVVYLLMGLIVNLDWSNPILWLPIRIETILAGAAILALLLALLFTLIARHLIERTPFRAGQP